MPYIGFEGPLALLSFPLAFATAFILGYPHLRRSCPRAAPEGWKPDTSASTGWKLHLPMLGVMALMAAIRLFPQVFPDLGLPLVFCLGGIAGLFVGRRVRVLEAAYRALLTTLPVLGLLAGIGILLQIMTLTGVRGLLVVTVLALPVGLTYLGMLVSLPVFGGVSAFASGMVFGIPFLLSLLGRNEIVVCSGIAVLAAMGDLLPPSAIVARFAAQAVGEDSFAPIIRKCAPFMVAGALTALAAVHWADKLSFLTP
jgi:hypothetical protein